MPIKCSDGTCRSSYEDCPPAISCPKDKPFLCSTGVCAEKRSLCVVGEVCENIFSGNTLLTWPVKCPGRVFPTTNCNSASRGCKGCAKTVQDCEDEIQTH